MLTVVVAGSQLPGRAAEPKGASAALDLARKLNQAFIELADKVSPAVVVVRVAHKPSYVDPEDESVLALCKGSSEVRSEDHREDGAPFR